MGYNKSTIGGGSSTAVGNDWMSILGQGLTSGQFGSAPVQNPTARPDFSNVHNPQDLQNAIMNFQNQQSNSGGMGARSPGINGANPVGATTGVAGYMNQTLGSNPAGATYSNPNNPTPQGYNPTNVGVTPQGTSGAISALMTPNAGMNFNFNAQNNPGASGQFNQAQNAMMNMAGQNQSNPFGGAATPAAPGVGAFNSQGILGDRSNVASGITGQVNLQNSQNLAAERARFTAMGGVSGGTPAAYAEAQTNAQGGAALANALASNDINYRNLDLNAYQAQNQANSQNYATGANIYGSQLNRLGTAGSLGINALQNVAGNEYNQQGMGFNYGQLDQSGQQNSNQLNLNSALGFSNLNQAGNIAGGNMGINAGQLQQQGQQYNNSNAYNSAQLGSQIYGQQGQLDLNTQAQQYQNQQNFINQLFNSLNGAANRGTPQATTSVTPDAGLNLLNAIPGVVNAGSKIATGGFGANVASDGSGYGGISNGAMPSYTNMAQIPPAYQMYNGMIPSQISPFQYPQYQV